MPRAPKRKATGDCFEAAGKYILDNPGSGLKLVHAEVMGQGPLEGVTFGHAFVLDGNNVIDVSNGRNIQMPAMIYYSLGQIDSLNNVFTYTEAQAREKILEFMHWGPWDLQTRSGL